MTPAQNAVCRNLNYQTVTHRTRTRAGDLGERGSRLAQYQDGLGAHVREPFRIPDRYFSQSAFFQPDKGEHTLPDPSTARRI
jgi:hypothetical protein